MSLEHITRWGSVICMFAALGCGEADDLGESESFVQETLSAEAARVPWSGYWWSMQNGELVLGWDDQQGRAVYTEEEVRAFDSCLPYYDAECVQLFDDMVGEQGQRLSPLMKFDWYVRQLLEQDYGPGGAPMTYYAHAARWELDYHYIGDNTEHRYWDSRGYAGKCIGWALATFDFDEPTADVELRGVRFRPADIKGILASIYNGAQFFIPDELTAGNAYHDVEGSDSVEFYEDVRPDHFVRALLSTIGEGRMLEADLDPADGVWNYPIHRYELSYRRRSKQRVEVQARLYHADDEVGIDEVFSTNPERPDLKTRDLTFDLNVSSDWSGDLRDANGGRWTGASVDDHPDALILGIQAGWRDSIYDYRSTQMKEEVNFALIKRLNTTGSWEPVVDQLLADYYGSGS